MSGSSCVPVACSVVVLSVLRENLRALLRATRLEFHRALREDCLEAVK